MQNSVAVLPSLHVCVRAKYGTNFSAGLVVWLTLVFACGTTEAVFYEISPTDAGMDAGIDVAWRLPPGHFIPARMPMHLVHPRPDGETSGVARHRQAHPGLVYEIPLGVQGGAWPFLYELIDAPSGARLGRAHGDADYGVVTWTAPAAGAFTFRVRVTDQELNVVDVDWSVQVDAAAFLFVDGDSGDDGNDGTLSAPLRTFAGVYKGDRDDASFAGRILVFRGAANSYVLSGDLAQNNNNAVLAGDRKPIVWIAYPGERPVIDAAQSKVFVEGAHDDLYFAGLRFEHGRQDVANAHFVWVTGVGDRSTFFRNTFFDLGPGSVGSEGGGAIWINDANAVKEHILVKQNRYEEVRNSDGLGAYASLNSVRYGLIEEEEAVRNDTRSGWSFSRAFGFTTIRANRARDSGGGQITVNLNREDTENQEVCWNDIRGDESSTPLLWSGTRTAPGVRGSFLYRNTLVGARIWLRFPGEEPYRTDGNVIVVDDVADFDAFITQSADEPDLLGARSDGVVDGENRLLAAFSEHRGLRGHVVE